MNICIDQYNKARREIESRFTGLPYAHTTLVSMLISRANPRTGIVEDINYRDLGSLLTVTIAPGRKEGGCPEKSTIRSFLRTIETHCGNDFQMASEGQQLIIKFPTLPKIYTRHAEIREKSSDQSTVLSPVQLIEKPDKKDQNKEGFISDQYPDLCTEESTVFAPVKNITKTNITNKQQTNTACNQGFHSKKPIDAEFYPTQETIALAVKQGLAKVIDVEEINKFIAYNQANGSRWQDYNPIFIKWLEREKQQQASIHQQAEPTKRHSHERRPDKSRTYELTMEAVLAANGHARSPSELDRAEKSPFVINGTHRLDLGGNDGHLWPTLREQTRNAR